MGQDRWVVRTTAAAKTDFEKILRWTSNEFGAHQAQTYLATLTQALEDLCGGPDIIGSKALGDFAPGIHTLHVARKGRTGRHFVVFRFHSCQGHNVMEVLRILHDSMDLTRHLPPH